MTKRDVADIALVWIGLQVFIQFLSILCTSIGRLLFQDAPNTTWDSSVSLYTLHAVVLLFIAFVMLIKRRFIVNLLFPLAGQTEMTVSDGCAVLTDLAFWIRLLGTFTLIQATITAASNLARYFPARNMNLGTSIIWSTITPPLFTIPLALLVVWKSEQIAALMNKLGKSNTSLNPISGSSIKLPEKD